MKVITISPRKRNDSGLAKHTDEFCAGWADEIGGGLGIGFVTELAE
jgi:hypothetical protein